YLFDVRTPAEYEAGHRHDFRNAPGGQLVQATDEYAVVRGARLVLADDDLTRATMSASWLQEMGWEVYVYALGKENEPLRTGKSPEPSHSPQVTLPRDPADSQVALRGMQEYLDWEIALVDQYDRDELARFTENGWA
ncbi:MAG TPA: thiosulfate sulfurtransferase, partial [Acidimicrobiaceae bacterium]|nr:thiosulfate sulfurtransferase [Acidimicrobiaceae bacterium]